MNDRSKEPDASDFAGFGRKHPLLMYLFLLALAFLTGPLMIAANSMSAVLYKDF